LRAAASSSDKPDKKVLSLHPRSYQQAPVGIFVLMICTTPELISFPDRSWKRELRQEKIGLSVEAAIGDTSRQV
jgi:hypothetical protein